MHSQGQNIVGKSTAARLVAERIARAVCADHEVSEARWQQALLAPLAEFLNRPGKQFRGGLVAMSWVMAGRAPVDMPAQLPLTLELLHAGSLIIDDIQDGSNTRRGAPALHRLYGVPLAINTGNWLYFAAAALVDECALAADVSLALHQQVRTAVLSCHHGQGLDLSVRVSSVPPAEIPGIVAAATALKTAALVELAATLGAVAAGGQHELVAALGEFGRELGTALQMFDDLGGVVARERRDKGIEDLRNGRPTWVWAWAAKYLPLATLARLLADARAVEHGAAEDADIDRLLEQLGEAVGQRARAEASARLRAAYQRLAGQVRPSDTLRALALEVERLERSYG